MMCSSKISNIAQVTAIGQYTDTEPKSEGDALMEGNVTSDNHTLGLMNK